MSKLVTVGGQEVKAKRIKSGLYLLGNTENENIDEKIVICRNLFILRLFPHIPGTIFKQEPIRIMSMEDNVITTENVGDEFYYAIHKSKFKLTICKIAKDGTVEDNLLSKEEFFLPQKRIKIHKEVAGIMTDLALEEIVLNN